MTQPAPEVQERILPPLLMAGIRMRGRYSDCGKAFAQLGRKLGRHLAGKPFLLHYSPEYRPDDADFEACFPIRQTVASPDGISICELPGGKCVTLLHQGPYDQMAPSYSRILQYIKDKGYHIVPPTREIYLKGPGMIFRGNPRKYLTEIQMLVATGPA